MPLKKIVMRALNEEIEQYADKILDLERQEVHVKSGALKDSLSKEKKGDGHFLVGVDADKLKADPRNIGGIDYSSYYANGHGAYTIVPKKVTVLSWIGKDGKRHYAKKVHIPAHAGDPFLQRVIARRPKI